MEKTTIHTAGLIVLKDNKLLLAYSDNKQAWYLAGGKIDKEENSIDAITREVREELNLTLDPERLSYYCHITAPAYGELPHIIMEQDCFLYHLHEEIEPSNEISEVKFFNLQMYQSEPAQVVGVIKVFERLIQDNLLS